MDDLRVELAAHELVDRVDLLAVARAEAEVVQPRAILIELAVALVGRCAAHQDAGAAADAVDDPLALDQRLHLEEVAELLPERAAALRIVHGELDVGDPVELDGHRGPLGGRAAILVCAHWGVTGVAGVAGVAGMGAGTRPARRTSISVTSARGSGWSGNSSTRRLAAASASSRRPASRAISAVAASRFWSAGWFA